MGRNLVVGKVWERDNKSDGAPSGGTWKAPAGHPTPRDPGLHIPANTKLSVNSDCLTLLLLALPDLKFFYS